MNVGFTGTQEGLTLAQRRQLVALLDEAFEHYGASGDEFHYGACVGADEESAPLARWVGYRVVAHPASDVAESKRAQPLGRVLAARPALERNRDICDSCQRLYAAPRGRQEERRSGTWATIRYARRVGLAHWIVYPDGSYEEVMGR